MGNPADSGASVATGPVHSGTRALQIQPSATAYRNAVQEKPAQAGAGFSASAWGSTSNLAGGAEVWLAWYGPGMVSLRWDPIGTLKATSPWTRFSGTKIAPAGTALVRIVLRTAAEPDGSGSAWFDDASLSNPQ